MLIENYEFANNSTGWHKHNKTSRLAKTRTTNFCVKHRVNQIKLRNIK